MRLTIRLCAAWLACALTTATAHAGPGHDHGGAPAIAAAAGAPRFVAESESFELVGLLEGRRLSLWLDHASSNAPVNDAVLTIDLAGNSLVVRSTGEGQFEVELAQVLPVGVHTLTATVAARRKAISWRRAGRRTFPRMPICTVARSVEVRSPGGRVITPRAGPRARRTV